MLNEGDTVGQPIANAPTAISAEAAEKLLRCYYLAEFISEGIVDKDYKPPVQLTTSFRFTSRGKGLVNQTKGGNIEMRDAQTAVFVTAWAGNDLLIDLENCDIDTICATLSSEIKRKRIRLPWIYGRALYDKVADSPFWGVSHPTAEESKRLIQELPQGVFQLGPYLSGPYGFLEARQWRTVFYSHTVPGFHCEEVECNIIHGVHLTSGDNGVNRAMLAIREKLSKSTKLIGDEYIEAVTKVASSYMPPYTWNQTTQLPFFLIDTCSIEELRLLLIALLNSKDQRLREICRNSGLNISSAKDFCESISDAELLQLILLAMDSEIHRELNNLIWRESGGISLQDGEIRQVKILHGGSGPLSVRMESSRLGVRYRPSSPHLPLRLEQIIDTTYPRADRSAQARLSWRLRHIDGDTALSKLKVALAEEQPVDIIERLLVSDELTYVKAFELLGLSPEKLTHRADRDIARLIAWHIGFPVEIEQTEITDLQAMISEMRRVLGNLPANYLERSDIDKVAGVAVKLFPALEKVLKVTLQFTSWALLRDHYDSGYELSYSPMRGREFFATWMRGRSSRIDDSKLAGMDLDLSELLDCFGVMAKFMRGIVTQSDAHLRPRDNWPRLSQEPSCPFEFPFVHTYPILDLNSRSASSLIATLEKVAKGLAGAETSKVRNKFFHDSDEVPNREDISIAIGEIERRISDLAGQGLYPVSFTSSGSKSDKFGRRRHSFASDLGLDIVITRPSSIMLYGFPGLTVPQLVVAGARLERGGEPLRFTTLKDSSYMTKWEKNFPIRPPRRSLAARINNANDQSE